MVYYSENDPKAAAWLRELIKANLIARGEVDERSIEDVCANDLRGYVQHHFFAGIGGWSYALRLAGWPDDRPVWTGSCPCQPFSTAGKRKGTADERHLWPAWHWLIKQYRPDCIFGEQVASKDGITWLDTVSTDLEGEGYTVAPVVFPACGVGAPHKRERLWFVSLSDTQIIRLERLELQKGTRQSFAQINGTRLPSTEEMADLGFLRMADELPRPMAGVSGFGNAIVPQAAAEVIKAYKDAEIERLRMIRVHGNGGSFGIQAEEALAKDGEPFKT